MVNRERNSDTKTVSIKPEIIFPHFKLIHKEENGTPFNSSSSNNHISKTDEEITFEETMHAIHSMKLNTCPGTDEIPSGVYRALNEQWISLPTNLFNDVLRSGEYPSCWLIGHIYRGITLLNCIGKIFTVILGNRLCESAELNKLIPDAQFGFRRNKRTTDCNFILNTLIERLD